ncbi:MAG TPA: hypothetical protein VFA02_04410 [Pseudacidobacterium sp.]|nr:hypothetical protein [Pseudacidobacterium sp.]
MKFRLIFVLFCAVELFVLLIAFEQPAHAYVDPGSGLLIFQVAGSMLTGACFMLRRKLRRLFGHWGQQNPQQENQVNSDEAQTCGANSSR